MDPKIALIGRPNVGKSSFFNLVTNSRLMLVNCEPGTTRDRNDAYVNNNLGSFFIIDTAGIEKIFILKKLNTENFSLKQKIYQQTIIAIEKSDFIFFILEAHIGITKVDLNILKILRKSNKKIFLLINKIDKIKNSIYKKMDFYELGFSSIYFISVVHNIGILKFFRDFNKEIEIFKKNKILNKRFYNCNKLNNINVNEKLPLFIKVCLIGPQNVGKSTLVNCLSKSNRIITDNSNGTTRDVINVSIQYSQKEKYTIIDTAGLRRKKNNLNFLENVSLLKIKNVIKTCQVVVLLLDVCNSFKKQDKLLFDMVKKKSRSFCVFINKWDLIKLNEKKKIRKKFFEFFKFEKKVPLYFISALNDKYRDKFFYAVKKSYNNSIKKLNSNRLTKLINQCILKHPLPLGPSKKSIRLKYAHVYNINPLTIKIHGNQTQYIKKSYKKYLLKQIQKKFNLFGTFIRLILKNTKNPYI